MTALKFNVSAAKQEQAPCVGGQMPRFFFDLYDDVVALDGEGVELADAAAAQETARKSALHIASAQVLEGHLNLAHHIEIRAEDGTVLSSLRLGDVVRVSR